MTETVVTVGLGDRSYPIRISSGLMAKIGSDLKQKKIGTKYGVIADDTVAALYGEQCLHSLRAAGIQAELISFPHGEENKHMGTVAILASELAQRGFDRGDALIALGGGVTGDITGFLAAIYMRGIPFVQVPTTLLSQVDSSVGGKTGVDLPEGKNLVGVFYQPKVVYIDIDVLSTLPPDELRGGLAEVIKYGVIHDAEFFSFLRKNRDAVFALQQDVLGQLIARCCEIKAWVVEQDEREGGLRRILNFGHTIGHAVEAASKFQLIHGKAVAIGMCAVAGLAVRTGCLSENDARLIQDLIEQYELPVAIPAELDRELIKKYLLHDKKTIGGRVFYVLPEAVGKVMITDQVREDDVDAVIA
ncbi:MAG: 3-dehydroquinate synthase [Candidatus Electrothrix aestuarii]|uniref:3-dehydroquinate synthase n=1 Tax=Candidatus Electrothrix aestuarii TaxID=3062594 RepID=A0AAU8LSS0_9BACT|nr:3-dehydroquinate synthase [Candidatus Electrothrix aestuarii]